MRLSHAGNVITTCIRQRWGPSPFKGDVRPWVKEMIDRDPSCALTESPDSYLDIATTDENFAGFEKPDREFFRVVIPVSKGRGKCLVGKC